ICCARRTISGMARRMEAADAPVSRSMRVRMSGSSMPWTGMWSVEVSRPVTRRTASTSAWRWCGPARRTRGPAMSERVRGGAGGMGGRVAMVRPGGTDEGAVDVEEDEGGGGIHGRGGWYFMMAEWGGLGKGGRYGQVRRSEEHPAEL